MLRDFTQEADGNFGLQVGLGQLRNHKSIIKFGRNLVTASTEAPVWTGSGDYIYLETPETLSFVSTSADDTDQGAGAWTLTVQGLDVNWEPIEETLVLNGLTPVVTTLTFLRAFRAWVVTGNSIVGQAGTITGTASTSLVVQIHILPEHNQTLMAMYTVPAGKMVAVMGITASVAKADQCAIRSYARDNTIPNSVKRCQRTFDLYQQYGGQNFPVPYIMGEKTDMWIAAEALAQTVSVSAAWYMIELPLSYIE